MELKELHSSIVAARDRIKGLVHHTPLEPSSGLSVETGVKVYLKCENEQRTGSLKVRGAVNKLKLLQLSGQYSADNPPVTASCGNHALACVYAQKALGMQCSIVVPKTIAAGKDTSLKLQGADLTYHGTDAIEVEIRARKIAKERGTIFVSPYNDYDVVAGQGTIGAEILEDLSDVDAVFIAVGGGGIIAGIAAYIKAVRPEVKVIGCQPKRSKVMFESVKAGKIIEEESFETLSDGTAGGIEEDTVTFPLCQKYVDDWVVVEEENIGPGVFSILDLHHKVVEGAAGVVVAALRQTAAQYQGQKVVLVLCGANIGVLKLQEIIEKNIKSV